MINHSRCKFRCLRVNNDSYQKNVSPCSLSSLLIKNDWLYVGESICQLLVFESLDKFGIVLSGDVELLLEDLDELSCLVFDLGCRKLQQHDEEVARVEARAILDDLAQVVRHEPHHVVQLVLFVRCLHHLLEVFADFSGSASLLCLLTVSMA